MYGKIEFFMVWWGFQGLEQPQRPPVDYFYLPEHKTKYSIYMVTHLTVLTYIINGLLRAFWGVDKELTPPIIWHRASGETAGKVWCRSIIGIGHLG